MTVASAPHRVLIADDDDDIRRLVEIVLQKAGIPADSVDGGIPALEAARTACRQLVVLDVRMPDMSGLEVCRQLKADDATSCSHVLLMSSDYTTEDVAAGYAAGADDYLPKPFSPGELVRRVTRLLVGSPDSTT
ncbi:response regulator [Jatrophihabitans sp.]|uniref:response regulator n=1 Tax=Jatrophihabitans sp. TaxID=1932789 RepID=UPI0030C67CEB|nr:response regulator receiver protein [Jatrophihabitans sp.]